MSKANQIANRCVELGYDACALTDHGSISGSVQFIKECKKKNIKPILGIEAYVTENNANIKDKNNIVTHQIILAKNYKGWLKLIQLVSRSNNECNFYYKPRIDIEIMREICDDNLISFSGHPGSTLCLRLGMPSIAENYIDIMKDIFGPENFFVEIQTIDPNSFPGNKKLVSELRELAIKTNTKTIATGDSHYTIKQDAIDHRVLLCSSLQLTFNDIKNKKDIPLDAFFKSDCFHIPSVEELIEWGNTSEEINNTTLVADMCEAYDITGPPKLPTFDCPNNLSNNEYLKELCRKGWKRLVQPTWNKEQYVDRIKHELSVIEEANLAGYFLIVQDYVNWAKNQGWLVGPGRGCLSPDTQIMLHNGQLINISNIKIGDFVFGSDGVKRKVLDKFKYKNNDRMIYIRTFYGHSNGIKLTEDHKVLAEKHKTVKNYHNWSQSTQKGSKKYEPPQGNPEWIRAQDLCKNDWVYIPKIQTQDKSFIFDLATYCNNTDLRYNDNHIYYEPMNKLCNVKMFSKQCYRYIPLNNDFARILGIFTGDGWIVFSTNNKIGFAFNKKEIKNIEFVKNFFEQLGCAVYVHVSKTKQLTQLTIKHKIMAEFFKDLYCNYKTSLTKHVPECILSANKEIIASFLQGYLQSDGHESSGKISFTTISQRLAEEIKFLCLCVGIPASIRIDDRIGQRNITHKEHIITCPINNKFGTRKTQANYVYQEFDNYILVQIKDIEIVQGDSLVYDIEVEGSHNYLSSNGIVHNSAAGCLVSYLLNITTIDPIKHNLIFERFYSKGRNTDGHISLPDIDVDFPITKRKRVIDYLRQKYGYECVCQMVTFGRLQGRGALKEVLRINNVCDFEQMNIITKNIPQEAEINDQMEEAGETSIINWTLKNDPKGISDWCYINNNGEIVGEYAEYFKQAIRLEGTYKSQGKHAAGVVVSAEPLDKICPMINDKNSSEKIAGLSMGDLENMGHVKFDILGVLILDRLMGVNNLLKKGRIEDETDKEPRSILV
jgi:intein/homing endonuclease